MSGKEDEVVTATTERVDEQAKGIRDAVDTLIENVTTGTFSSFSPSRHILLACVDIQSQCVKLLNMCIELRQPQEDGGS